MCLRGTCCIFLCTPCMVEREDSCSASGVDASSRDVDETVRAQLKNATMGSFWGRSGGACGGRVKAQPQKHCDGRVG